MERKRGRREEPHYLNLRKAAGPCDSAKPAGMRLTNGFAEPGTGTLTNDGTWRAGRPQGADHPLPLGREKTPGASCWVGAHGALRPFLLPRVQPWPGEQMLVQRPRSRVTCPGRPWPESPPSLRRAIPAESPQKSVAPCVGVTTVPPRTSFKPAQSRSSANVHV